MAASGEVTAPARPGPVPEWGDRPTVGHRPGSGCGSPQQTGLQARAR